MQNIWRLICICEIGKGTRSVFANDQSEILHESVGHEPDYSKKIQHFLRIWDVFDTYTVKTVKKHLENRTLAVVSDSF
jgi:hypothetical protein